MSQLISHDDKRHFTVPIYVLLILLMGAFAGAIHSEIATVAGIMLVTGAIGFRLWSTVGKDLALTELAACIGVFQWVVCPYIAYHLPTYQRSQYAMSESFDTYFAYALPGTALFAVGLFSVQQMFGIRLPPLPSVSQPHYPVIYTLIGMSLIGDALASFTPSSLEFVVKIMSDMRFGAIILLLFSDHQFRTPLMLILFGAMLLRSTRSGMFHELILFAAIFTLYAFVKYYRNIRITSPPIWIKLTVFGVGSIMVFELQLVKAEFRRSIHLGDDTSLLSLVVDRGTNVEYVTAEETLARVLTRFNQGWIISRVMTNMPQRLPFQNGISYLSAVEMTLKPRLLFPDRPTIDIAERFRKYTGVRINASTCMGVSLLGEAYANFGPLGGIFAMLMSGWVLAGAIEIARALSYRFPLLVFLLGIVFSEPLKAETDSTMVLNYIVKAAVVVLLLVFLFGNRFRLPGKQQNARVWQGRLLRGIRYKPSN